jgi:hypothetical protein
MGLGEIGAGIRNIMAAGDLPLLDFDLCTPRRHRPRLVLCGPRPIGQRRTGR